MSERAFADAALPMGTTRQSNRPRGSWAPLRLAAFAGSHRPKSGNDPWLFYMTKGFVERCLDTIYEIIDGVGVHARPIIWEDDPMDPTLRKARWPDPTIGRLRNKGGTNTNAVRVRTAQRDRPPRRGYPNLAIDSTNRTKSTCREIGSFW